MEGILPCSGADLGKRLVGEKEKVMLNETILLFQLPCHCILDHSVFPLS